MFSSRQLVPVAEAIRENLEDDFRVAPWTEGFFRSDEVPVDTFLRALLVFDGAVVVLGADDLRLSQTDATQTGWIPRESVIFELGACLARFGAQRTFIVCPERPAVQWPGYLSGIDPLTYDERVDGNLPAVVDNACASIRRQLTQLDPMASPADLPAVGLSYGYFVNFVNPAYQRLQGGGRPLTFHGEWRPDQGFSIAIVIPERFMNRDQVHDTFQRLGLEKLDLDLLDGRNISVYARPRTAAGPLHVFDIPTTLVTSGDVIQRIARFWGDDRGFRESLERREIASFERSVKERIREHRLSEAIRTIGIGELPAVAGPDDRDR